MKFATPGDCGCFKNTVDFRLNREILKFRKKIGTYAISLIVNGISNLFAS